MACVTCHIISTSMSSPPARPRPAPAPPAPPPARPRPLYTQAYGAGAGDIRSRLAPNNREPLIVNNNNYIDIRDTPHATATARRQQPAGSASAGF